MALAKISLREKSGYFQFDTFTLTLTLCENEYLNISNATSLFEIWKKMRYKIISVSLFMDLEDRERFAYALKLLWLT